MNKYNHHSPIHPTLESIHEDALQWVNQVLDSKGYAPVSQLHSIHSMAWSVVAKVEYEGGVWYFKALAAHLDYELAATKKISQAFPEDSAPFIASNSEKRYLLIGDLGQNLFDYQPQSECLTLWKQALTSYSEIQVKASKLGQSQFSTLPDRRLENIPSEAMPIIERCINIKPRDGEKAVTEAEVQWVRAYFAQWHNVVESIQTVPIPNSIHHGDLHGGNIAMKDKPVVFDWGDSSWSHPFVTFFISADACQHHLKLDDSGMSELRQAYLKPWADHAPMSQLEDILEQVNRISPLVMLLSWAYAISNKADERTKEWESGLCTWVNEFLRLNRV
jgi:hypothetical protein